jgi:hypothetical protein
MIKKSLLGFGLSILLCAGAANAQQKVSKVVDISASNIQPIKKGEKITGYYAFYKADKVKGGDYSYKIRILDQNAVKVAEKSVVASSLFYLLEAQYNGELLCFKFYDRKEKKVKLIFFNDKAEKVATKSYDIDKVERRMFEMRMQQGGEGTIPTVRPIENLGFVDMTTVKNEKVGYQLTFYPNDKTQKSWKYGSKKTSPISEYAGILEANEDVVICMVALRKSALKIDADYQVVGLDAKTGKELFVRKVDSPKYEESITNSSYNKKTKQTTLIGYYFKKGSNVLKDASLGIVMTTLDNSGKKINQVYTSWSKDIAKFLGASSKGKLADIGFIYFHEFVKKADGTYYGIGEAYRKTVSAGGIATKILARAGGGTGASAFQISVKDFFIFEFDANNKLTGVENVEKSMTRVLMPNGAGIYGPQLLALLVKSIGGFDFDYAKTLNEGKTLAVFYTDYEKIKGEKNKVVCGVISHTDGKYLVDKIDLETSATFTKVLPAQDGNILFVEYFGGEKKLEMNFKKMNY